ncbi:hypothetical protein CKAH01_03310 [Colletotrichum kahawae]|uniref:RING-type domain-containing protein n=1 Tax=Colletotrichum kahawae TaxID=34407 RepID=A0AAD9YTU9_COLKA|nr:hypothetical protein CKAH01_03310 [Colletotrichum kahawae]
MATVQGISKVQKRYLSTRRNRARQREEDSWLKRTFLPLVSSWLRPQDDTAPEVGRCFFPSPKVTFLIDKPEGLICQICQYSPLAFQEQTEIESGRRYSDSVPSIMPCGHLAGARCLSKWLREHNNCPFCRCELTYGQCGHRVPARHVTREEIFLIPTTIPDGGHIPDLCAVCYKDALRVAVQARLQVCEHRFVQARDRFLASNSPSDASLLIRRKADFENIMLDEYHTKATSAWLTCW